MDPYIQYNTTNTTVIVNQPSPVILQQGMRDWNTGLCGCFEDCYSCKLTSYVLSCIAALCDRQKISRHFLNQSEIKPQTTATFLHAFSRAWRQLYVYLLQVLIGSLDCIPLGDLLA